MKTINKESYTVKNKEVINFLSEGGGDSASRSSNCSFLYPTAGKLVDGTGILTYNRSEELYATRFSGKGGKKRKPLCNITYLYYDDKADVYYVEYEGARLITIHKHGWTLELPKYGTHILYPGYCTRIKNYTGLSVFKTNRNMVCVGSMRFPDTRFWRDRTLFIDYSFIYKNPHNMQYHSARMSVSNINKRKYTRTGWNKDLQVEHGRNYAISGTVPRATVFLKSALRSYVNQYLSGYCLNSSRLSFSDFCSERVVSYSSAPHAMGKSDKCWPLPVGCPSYLEFPSLYSIDDLYNSAIACSDGSNIAKYGLLAQAMLCMRGLRWLPDNGTRVGRRTSVHTFPKETPSDFLQHPYIDKYSFSSYENTSRHYSDGSLLNSNQHKMSRELCNELGCRRGLLEQFLQYLLCVSNGGHPKIRRYNRDNLQTDQSSGRYGYTGATNGNISNEGQAISYVADIFLSMVPESKDPPNSRRWNNWYGTQHYTTMVTRSINQQPLTKNKDELDARVLYRDMDNPFPRLFFFIMLDEYISDSLLVKQSIVSLLDKEWDEVAVKNHGEINIERDMPLSFDIMHSFFNKRLHGIFLPLISGTNGFIGNSWYDKQHLIAYGTIDTTRGWYYSSPDNDNPDHIPSELNHPWENM
jgi:hypothetical protein